jgi:hypothetical protein
MRELWNNRSIHGTPERPHITAPGGRYCDGCGEDTVMLAQAYRATAMRRSAMEIGSRQRERREEELRQLSPQLRAQQLDLLERAREHGARISWEFEFASWLEAALEAASRGETAQAWNPAHDQSTIRAAAEQGSVAIRWTGGNGADITAIVGRLFDPDHGDKCSPQDERAAVYDPAGQEWAAVALGDWIVWHEGGGVTVWGGSAGAVRLRW